MTLKNNEHHLGQVLKPSSHTRTVSRSTWKTTTSLAASDAPVVRTRLRLPTDTRLMSFLSCSYMLSLSCFHPVVSCCLASQTAAGCRLAAAAAADSRRSPMRASLHLDRKYPCMPHTDTALDYRRVLRHILMKLTERVLHIAVGAQQPARSSQGGSRNTVAQAARGHEANLHRYES